jgi:hypothetical protein
VEIDAVAAAGGGTTIATVRLLVDGNTVSTLSASPAQFIWDSTSVANGAHVLVVEAIDADLNTGYSQLLHLTVNNAPPPTPPSKKGGCASEGAGLAAIVGLLALRRRRPR